MAKKLHSDLHKLATGWLEVRPEWGLAGKALFIASPLYIMRHVKLDSRSFSHSYNYMQDAGGKVLETIMTAPMNVAHWIDLHYYATTVDNHYFHYFGSASKTVHNVVGRFGILSGHGGDLLTDG